MIIGPPPKFHGTRDILPTHTTRAYPNTYDQWVIDSTGPVTVWRLGLDS